MIGMSASRRPSLETLAARYLNERRGRPAYKGAPRAGIAASKVLKPLSAKFGPGTDILAENWSDIVGDRLAGWSSPDAIRGGTLYIIAKGPAGALIEADAPRILERTALLTGKLAPTRIRVKQGTPKSRSGASHAHVSREVNNHMTQGVEIDPDARLSSALERFERAARRRERGE